MAPLHQVKNLRLAPPTPHTPPPHLPLPGADALRQVQDLCRLQLAAVFKHAALYPITAALEITGTKAEKLTTVQSELSNVVFTLLDPVSDDLELPTNYAGHQLTSLLLRTGSKSNDPEHCGCLYQVCTGCPQCPPDKKPKMYFRRGRISNEALSNPRLRALFAARGELLGLPPPIFPHAPPAAVPAVAPDVPVPDVAAAPFPVLSPLQADEELPLAPEEHQGSAVVVLSPLQIGEARPFALVQHQQGPAPVQDFPGYDHFLLNYDYANVNDDNVLVPDSDDEEPEDPDFLLQYPPDIVYDLNRPVLVIIWYMSETNTVEIMWKLLAPRLREDPHMSDVSALVMEDYRETLSQRGLPRGVALERFLDAVTSWVSTDWAAGIQILSRNKIIYFKTPGLNVDVPDHFIELLPFLLHLPPTV
ncbi:hypothetical protein C8R46DRAFT_1326685 [Mycena filopes]|nr:hypothetical protein C8R46DRAFT_1326685 [Mycena filopes]